MIFFLIISIFINFITVFMFTTLKTISTKKSITPKQRAMLGSLSGITLFLYLLMTVFIFALGLINKNILMLTIIIFAFIPFIIGKYVKYETISKYLLIQIASFIVSLAILFILLAEQMI